MLDKADNTHFCSTFSMISCSSPISCLCVFNYMLMHESCIGGEYIMYSYPSLCNI